MVNGEQEWDELQPCREFNQEAAKSDTLSTLLLLQNKQSSVDSRAEANKPFRD